jgi:hypothetical protein
VTCSRNASEIYNKKSPVGGDSAAKTKASEYSHKLKIFYFSVTLE